MRPAAAAERASLRDEHADHAQRPDQHQDVEVAATMSPTCRLPSSTWWPPYQRIADEPERRQEVDRAA